MSGYRLDLSIPGLPPMNTAAGLHWRVRQAYRQDWETRVAYLTAGRRPHAPLQLARVTITRHSTHEPDFENLTQGGKFILDGLVKIRVLADDSPKVIGQPTYLWSRAPRGHGRVDVLVEEIQPTEDAAACPAHLIP